MQKEAEREEKFRQRREEREKQNELKPKRPNRRQKRNITGNNDEVRTEMPQSKSTENIETPKTIGELKKFVKTSKTPCTKNDDKRCKVPRFDNKSTVFPIVNKTQSLHRNVICDFPFWFGSIEPFRGTKFNYKKQDQFLEKNQSLSGFVGKDKECNISDEEDPLCGIKYDKFKSLEKTRAPKNPSLNDTYVQSNTICVVNNEERGTNLTSQNNTGKEIKSRSLNYDCTNGDDANNDIKPAQKTILGNDEKLIQSDDEPPDEGPILRASPVISHSTIDVTAIGSKNGTTQCNVSDHEAKLDQKSAFSSLFSVDVKSTSPSKIVNQEIRKDHSKKQFENKNEPCFKRRSFKVVRKTPQPPTLLEKLLVKNIEKERDELLQCIRYVVDKKFLQN